MKTLLFVGITGIIFLDLGTLYLRFGEASGKTTANLSTSPKIVQSGRQHSLKQDLSVVETPLNYERIVSAIYTIEGGIHTSFPYGISCYGHISQSEAKQICLNTIQHNYRRWTTEGSKGSFYNYLASKYDPINTVNWRRMLVSTLNKQQR